MLTKTEANDLKRIVGARWLSTAPCMMDTYAFYMNPEVLIKDGGRWAPRPAAVALPGSVEEIQAIVKYCNQTDLMVKPLSTGFGTWAAASRDRVIVLDLKRLNNIVEIDVKNQIAVIEPYVRAIDLQTEVMKHGLNVHVVSCGGNHSVLASTVAAWGYGLSGASMSYSGRNLMGVEWVLPTGEVYRLGSAGDCGRWFSADGPGPSMRGVVRGFQGTMGGLGVFTKCAVKLYKWDGPANWEVTGSSPGYVLKKKFPRVALNALSFPSSQAMRDAGYLLGEAELEYAQFRTPMFFTVLGLTDNNQELKIFLDSGVFQQMTRYVLINAVVGHSDREFKWKMKALKMILRRTGGVRLMLNVKPTAAQLRILARLLRYFKDPLFLLRRFPFLQDVAAAMPLNRGQDMASYSRLFWLLIRHANNTQGTFRPTQGMFTTLGAFDTWDLGVVQSDWIAEAKKEYIRRGLILDDDGDLGCGGLFENGHLGYLEGIGLYDTKDPASVMAAGELVEKGVTAAITRAFGVPIAGFGQEMNSRFGPVCHDYHQWLGKIKAALDPHDAADSYFYYRDETPGSSQG